MKIAGYEVSLNRLMNLTEYRDSNALVRAKIGASNIFGDELGELHQAYLDTEAWVKEEEAGLARVKDGAARAKDANEKRLRSLAKKLASTREAAEDAPSRRRARELDEAAAGIEADIALIREDDLQKDGRVAAAGTRVAYVRSRMHMRRERVLRFLADALYTDIVAEAEEAGAESRRELKNAEVLRCLEADPGQTKSEALRRSEGPAVKKWLMETDFTPSSSAAG